MGLREADKALAAALTAERSLAGRERDQIRFQIPASLNLAD
jgi:hypothetical protein